MKAAGTCWGILRHIDGRRGYSARLALSKDYMSNLAPSVNIDRQRELLQKLAKALAEANKLTAEDIEFIRLTDPKTAGNISMYDERVTTLANRLADSLKMSGGRLDGFDDDPIIDRKSGKTNMVLLKDMVDELLEQSSKCLEEVDHDRSSATSVISEPPDFLDPHLRHANILKPQHKFSQKVDNFVGWKPLYKPNRFFPDIPPSELCDTNSPVNPFEQVIRSHDYPPIVYKQLQPIKSQDFGSMDAIWIDSSEKLDHLIQELLQADAIAVDLEHHNLRTFMGLTCLIQISTRQQDYIIDALAIREDVHKLQEVFLNPDILKVFHGADSDVQWLQRDFGLYLVSMFDTACASKVLHEEKNSLKHLLLKYVGYNTSKKFQLADWRIRPIPSQMLRYAQSDTHFLLEIFDILRNKLLSSPKDPEQNDIPIVLAINNSRKVAARNYNPPVYDINGHLSGGWKDIIRDNSRLFKDDPRAVWLLQRLHKWRDETARIQDESIHYILPTSLMVSIISKRPQSLPQLKSIAPKGWMSRSQGQQIIYMVVESEKHDHDATNNSVQPTISNGYQAQSSDQDDYTPLDPLPNNNDNSSVSMGMESILNKKSKFF